MEDSQLLKLLGGIKAPTYSFVAVKLFKKDIKIYPRRSFKDLFTYFKALKVTEKQLLRCLIKGNFIAGVCHDIKKVVFFGKVHHRIIKDFIWIDDALYWNNSKKNTKVNDKYTVEYLNNLYNKILLEK